MPNKNGSNNGNGVHEDTAMATRNGNGHKPEAEITGGHDLLWDGLSPAVTRALEQPLDPVLVSQRKGRAGRVFDYLEGHVVIDQANRVFGYGGWGYEMVGEVALRRIETVDVKTGEVKVSYGYSAPVRVTVPGAPPRTDTGFHAVTDETADGHETALKGAVTDGMKRALRSFGDRFGNGLYGDRQSQEARSRGTDAGRTGGKGGGTPRPQRVSSPAKGTFSPVPGNDLDETHVRYLRKRILELGVEQGFEKGQVRAAVRNRTGRDLEDLAAADLTPLVEGATRRLHQMQQGDAA